MRNNKSVPQTIDEYIETFPAAIRPLLEEMRRTIREAAPDAEETIAYQLPTFRLNGNQVHFGAFKNHIGFYPTPSAIKAFDRPIPLALISEMVQFRVRENLARK